jgi:flagellar biosynthesis protein FliR
VLTSLLANVALGIVGRLVPTLQLLTIAMPLQLLLAIAVLLLTVGAVVSGFGTFLRSSVAFLGA